MYVQTKSDLKGLARARFENGGGGFIAPITISRTIPIVSPIIPSFDVGDSKFGPIPVRPTLPAETRSDAVSPPVPSADSKLAFELAEAQKWGYTHSAWMAMGSGARCTIRSKDPGGYDPVTPSGVSTTAARIDLIEGRDPLRSIENYSGAGDHPGGIEIREPLPSVPLIATKSGVAFADVVKIDTTKIQTAAEAAGVTIDGGFVTPSYVRYGVWALAGWVLYDLFLKPKKVRRRRRSKPFRRQHPYPYESSKRHIRQGQQ